jgi:hypothetical protein
MIPGKANAYRYFGLDRWQKWNAHQESIPRKLDKNEAGGVDGAAETKGCRSIMLEKVGVVLSGIAMATALLLLAPAGFARPATCSVAGPTVEGVSYAD